MAKKQKAVDLAKRVSRNSRDLSVYVNQDWEKATRLDDVECALGSIQKDLEALRAGVRERILELDPEWEFPEA